MSLSYDTKPTAMHEEYAMGSLDARVEEVEPYEPGGAEEKVSKNDRLPGMHGV
jgi:hypothetical protein